MLQRREEVQATAGPSGGDPYPLPSGAVTLETERRTRHRPGATAAHQADRTTASHGAQPAEGSFDALVDFPSLTARDVRGNKCEFTVNGTLTFSGTLDGGADGTTTAVIFAPCDEALAAPPGTFFDVFRFEGEFAGEVLGEPASGSLSYAGVTRVGGAIDAVVILRGSDARAVLRADAQVAVGGTYSGVARAF